MPQSTPEACQDYIVESISSDTNAVRPEFKRKETEQQPSSQEQTLAIRSSKSLTRASKDNHTKSYRSSNSNFSSRTNSKSTQMADGRNEARALRVLEIMNDFKTLQVHITSLVTRTESNPPDQAAYYLDGYVVLRQCNAEGQAILATHYNPGSIGLGGSRVPDTEVQKATLQRIILDASTRRFSAHKIYLRAAAGMRWVQLRKQLADSRRAPEEAAQALRQIDTRLRQELSNITDESVVTDLAAADRRKGYWVDEDPALERMLAWIRRQA